MILAALMLTAAIASPETDFLAQMRAGKMLCTHPDVSSKTCSSIASYEVGENGAVVETAEMVLPYDKDLTFKATIPGRIVGSGLCGAVTEADFQSFIIRRNGSPLPPEQNSKVMTKVLKGMKPMVGRILCEILRGDGNKLMKHAQAEKSDILLPGRPVRWISADEGYKVGR